MQLRPDDILHFAIASTLMVAAGCSDTAPAASGWDFSGTSARDTGEPPSTDPDTGAPGEDAHARDLTVEETGTADTGQPPSDVDSSWMVGLWLVEQPYHATYEGTLFDFRKDGRVEMVKSFTTGRPKPFNTGKIGKCDDRSADAVVCTFGDEPHRWRAIGGQRIRVRTACSDGVEREAILRVVGRFEARRGESTTVESVEGETDWCHVGFQWRWSRCRTEKGPKAIDEARECYPERE